MNLLKRISNLFSNKRAEKNTAKFYMPKDSLRPEDSQIDEDLLQRNYAIITQIFNDNLTINDDGVAELAVEDTAVALYELFAAAYVKRFDETTGFRELLVAFTIVFSDLDLGAIHEITSALVKYSTLEFGYAIALNNLHKYVVKFIEKIATYTPYFYIDEQRALSLLPIAIYRYYMLDNNTVTNTIALLDFISIINTPQILTSLAKSAVPAGQD